MDSDSDDSQMVGASVMGGDGSGSPCNARMRVSFLNFEQYACVLILIYLLF